MVILKIRLKHFLLSFLIDFICYNHVLFSDETGRFSIVGYDCFLLKPKKVILWLSCVYFLLKQFYHPLKRFFSLTIESFRSENCPWSILLIIMFFLNGIWIASWWKKFPPPRKLKLSITKVRFVTKSFFLESMPTIQFPSLAMIRCWSLSGVLLIEVALNETLR